MTVELADAQWFKSSRSGDKADCVEVAFLAGGLVGVRDSKNPSGPALVFDTNAWERFATHVSQGHFDRS